MDQWTNGPMDQWTNGPMDQWTIGSMDHWTNGPMDQWTNGPLVRKRIYGLGLIKCKLKQRDKAVGPEDTEKI